MRCNNPFHDLTRFEFMLWLSSVAMITFSFILSRAGDALTLLASLVGVTALIFVAKGFVIGQILTIVFAMLYGIISFQSRYYGEMITYLGMTAPSAAATAAAWIRHPYVGTKEVEVHHLSASEHILMWILSLIVTWIFYYILAFLGNANLFFSTLSITTSFLASFLTFFRSPYYAAAYAANDVVLIDLWVLAAWQVLPACPWLSAS